MANPGHALASTNSLEIQSLKREVSHFREQYQRAMTQLARGMKELTELLEAKGVASKNELEVLSSLNIFMNMSHQQTMW